MFQILIFIALLFSAATASDLTFQPIWEKQSHSFQLVHQDTGKEHGRMDCWLVYDYDNGIKEAVISNIEVKRYAQGCGLGKYLFSRAIKCIESNEIVQKTTWYAYPKWKKETQKNFEKLLEGLCSFYEKLGGVRDKRKRDLGTYFHFDHTKHKLVDQRICDAEQPPVGYKLRELKEAKESLYAARVYKNRPNSESKALCEVQYKKQGRTKIITGIRLLDKRSAKATVAKAVDLIAEKLHVSRDVVEEALVGDVKSGTKLPTLYDDLFVEREDSEEE